MQSSATPRSPLNRSQLALADEQFLDAQQRPGGMMGDRRTPVSGHFAAYAGYRRDSLTESGSPLANTFSSAVPLQSQMHQVQQNSAAQSMNSEAAAFLKAGYGMQGTRFEYFDYGRIHRLKMPYMVIFRRFNFFQWFMPTIALHFCRDVVISAFATHPHGEGSTPCRYILFFVYADSFIF